MASISVLGYGVVGTGIADLINKNKEKFKSITGEDLNISSILVRDKSKHEQKQNYHLITDNIEKVFNSPVDIIVEVMGGIHPAYDYVKKALKLKKHVVTANKDLIAEHGKELLDLAEANGVTLNFEASVGGGIPILKPLIECLSGNEIIGIKAILNGTTNFILSKMYSENASYEDALKLAQELGFAEANPDSDVLGYDAARKLSILSTIAYNKKINWKDLNLNGITSIDKIDFEYAKLNECTIKLLAVSKSQNNKVYGFVQPVMVRLDSYLSKLDDELNGIVIEGDAVGNVFFSGKGAGMLPTASSVFGDITDIIQNKNKKNIKFNADNAFIEKCWCDKSSWLVRIKTEDRLNTICTLSNNFKNCHIYTSNVTQANEVAAVIYEEYESTLKHTLEKFLDIPYINEIKKFMVL
ncbi:homoserine dehydrogenase [Clostridium thailandense]|uniref:Homoserine dehydrogenase n=1 Tax=Clostridium thailandense TaxID=2794346 RepID=A0A949WX38_9CLOT|nr:homoserine dehydrogenase [Clostridium thailandense]MBV7275512.1 homoserine dehydrogenase [Clostridium thailandense]